MDMQKTLLVAGTANMPLARKISDSSGIPLCAATVTRFSDGEIFAQIEESVRGVHVFVVQPTCPPANDNLMELLVIIDALNRASASSVTAVTPYYGYSRQDRKVSPRTPITAKLVANLLTAAGVDRVKTLSDHRELEFANKYGLLIKELKLLARAILVVDTQGKVSYVQVVKEVADEPDYDQVLAEIRKLV